MFVEKQIFFTGAIHATLCIAVLMLASSTATAQATGAIHGRISDATGAVIPNAAVEAKNVGTGFVWPAVTNDLGMYLLPSLPPGPYNLSVQYPGFKTFNQTGITVVVGTNARVDATLELGVATQTVNVSGRALDVDTQSSTVGATIDSRRIADMPLDGRNLLALTQLLPGVGRASFPSVVLLSRSGPSVVVGGSRSNQNNVELDGTPLFASLFNHALNLPSPDSVQEFRALTGTYDAQHGRASGAVLQAVTKAGTREFHGSLFHYLRNDALNAQNFFATVKPLLRQNQFGGSIGGPVLFPGYNKNRDRTFFFFGYQGIRIAEQNIVTNFPPSPQERQGDFSASPQPVIDPTTGQPFPNNQIPPDRFDPMAVNILKTFIPLPNQPDGRSVLLNKRPTTGNQYTFRVDHAINSSNRLMFRWFHDRVGSENQMAGDILGLGTNPSNVVNTQSLTYTRVFSPRLLYEVAFSHLQAKSMATQVSKLTPKDLGGNYNYDGVAPYTPGAVVVGRFTMFPHFGLRERDRTLQIRNNLTWIPGRHALRLGAQIGILRHFTTGNIFGGGFSVFIPAFTGNAVADFLIGQPVSFSQNSLVVDDSRSRNYHFYVQDDFKVSSRLTLNLGLRYELNPVWWQAQERAGHFLLGQQSTRFPQAPPGLVYVGDPGVPRGLVDTDKNDLAPRVGFAWDLTGKGRTAIRGAFGVFYDLEGAVVSSHPNETPPFQVNISRFPVSFSDPYGVAQGGTDPFPFTVDAANPVFPTSPFRIYSINPRLRNGYMQQFTLNIQHQFTSTLVLETGYVGKLGRKLGGYRNMNQAVFGPGATRANVQSRRPFHPEVYAEILERTSDRNSSYHALQVNLKKNFSSGYTYQVVYTLSKSIDNLAGFHQDSRDPPQDANNYLAGERSLSSSDQRHIFAANFIWEVPWLKRNLVLGGWQFAGIIRASSGLPFSVSSGVDSALVGATSRADLIGDPRQDSDMYFNTAAFAQPAIGEFGNSGRNILIGPGFFQTDLSLQKRFQLPGERASFQFRADGFNIFNRVNFDQPGATRGTPGFGRIVSARAPRIVQLALRFEF